MGSSAGGIHDRAGDGLWRRSARAGRSTPALSHGWSRTPRVTAARAWRYMQESVLLVCRMHIGPGLSGTLASVAEMTAASVSLRQPCSPRVWPDLPPVGLGDRRLGWSGSSSGMWSGVCVLVGALKRHLVDQEHPSRAHLTSVRSSQITQRRDRLVARWLGTI